VLPGPVMDEPTTAEPESVGRCQVHAGCRGDAAGLRALDEQRRRRLSVLGMALGVELPMPPPAPPGRARVGLRPLPDGRLGQALPGSHDLVPLTSCTLLHPRLNQALPALPRVPRGLREVELRTDGERLVFAARSPRPGRDPALAQALTRLAEEHGEGLFDGLALDGRTLWGEAEVRFEVEGITHRLGPETFFQVHPEVNRQVVAAVVQAVRAAEASAVLDLYAGCGNLGLPLARAGLALTMIESAASSVADARRTAAAHGLTVDIRAGDAGAFKAGQAFFDAVVLDPPRAGAPGVLAQLVLTRPRLIVYLSCTPALLARDLAPALKSGYRLDLVQAFDMFPGTEHLEVLAVLRRV